VLKYHLIPRKTSSQKKKHFWKKTADIQTGRETDRENDRNAYKSTHNKADKPVTTSTALISRYRY